MMEMAVQAGKCRDAKHCRDYSTSHPDRKIMAGGGRALRGWGRGAGRDLHIFSRLL